MKPVPIRPINRHLFLPNMMRHNLNALALTLVLTLAQALALANWPTPQAPDEPVAEPPPLTTLYPKRGIK